jgi:hypothetical protein
MTDPLTRVEALILREQDIRAELALLAAAMSKYAGYRRAALWDLKKELGTWKKVADATGQTIPAITKAAYKKAKEGTP